MKPAFAILFVCSVLIASSSAGAETEPTDDSTEALARERFRRGVELYREGNFEMAAAELQRAYALTQDYRLLYNMAQVQSELLDYVSATRLLESYLAQGGSLIAPERREEVDLELSILQSRVAKLSVSVNVKGAELWVNGARLGRLPMSEPLLLNPGVCHVRIEKAGYTTVQRDLAIERRESYRLDLVLEPEADAMARDQRRNYTPFWLGVGATGVSGGLAVGVGLFTRQANQRLDTELSRIPARPNDVSAARSRVKMFAALTDAFIGVTAIGLGVSTYFLVRPPHESEPPSSTVGLKFVPTGSGGALLGTF